MYADTAGSNLNSGSTSSTSATYTSTGGSYNSGTGVFTPASGNPSLTVNVGDIASIYPDGTSGATVFLSRVTAVSSTTITVSTTAIAGTGPIISSNNTCKVGGAFKGPNGATALPYGFLAATLTDASGNTPRVNFKAGTYSITAAMTHSIVGPIKWQGYTSSVGDGGKATIDGGTSGASYTLLTLSGQNNDLEDLVFANNGASSNATGVIVSGSRCTSRRVVVHDVRGHGLDHQGNGGQMLECEGYNCNQSNTATTGALRTSVNSGQLVLRCNAHDNSGSNTAGFLNSIPTVYDRCIADTNGGIGFNLTATSGTQLLHCDAYNNVSDGVRLANATAGNFYLENCNLVKNGGWGINGSGAGARDGLIVNCAFGTGTQVNTSGTTTGLSAMVETGSINYASGVTPWVDPANGDFRINLAAAKGAGRGTFTETSASYTGTVAAPDIGAGQSNAGTSGGGAPIIGSSIVRGVRAL